MKVTIIIALLFSLQSCAQKKDDCKWITPGGWSINWSNTRFKWYVTDTSMLGGRYIYIPENKPHFSTDRTYEIITFFDDSCQAKAALKQYLDNPNNYGKHRP